MGAPFLYDHHVNRIREALWRPDQGAAIMIGSGFSRNARPLIADQKKMPLWSELGDGLRRELGLGADPGALAQGLTRTAERYRQEFGDGALEEFVERIIRDEDFSPGDLHKQLLSLPWADVFTTNFDTLLERGARSVASRRYGVINDQRQLVGRRGPSIIKLHGTVGDPRSMTLTEDHFRRYPREKAAFVNTVRQSMIEKVFLLLGFSGDDPNFLAWAGWIRDELGSSAHKIYLCSWLRAGPSDRGWGADSNIVPIDLSQIPEVSGRRDDERHEFTIKWFLDRLQQGEPPPAYAWPSRSAPRGTSPKKQILDPAEVIFVESTAGIAGLYAPDRYPDLEEHVDPLREELSKFRWRHRSAPTGDGAEADAYDRLFDPDGADEFQDHKIRRGDAAALFIGALSREASLMFAQRQAYPGWVIFPIGNRERDGVVRHVTAWADTIETILTGEGDARWQKAREVLHVLSGNERVLDVCRARLFCFLRELSLRLGLCLSPIGPRWPRLAKLIARVIEHEGDANSDAPWSPSDLRCVTATRDARGGPWAAEHEAQTCVNGAINLLVALLEDARDVGDAKRFGQLARSLSLVSRRYPALDLDWRVQHARLVMSACLDIAPEVAAPAAMQTQAPPSDVMRWVRRAAANAAFNRLPSVEADCRRALEILSTAHGSVDQRIWLQSREAWIVFACKQATSVVGEARCRQDDAYGNAFHPDLLRDRLDLLSGTTDPYAELRVVQSTKDGNPFLLWRLLLESGHLPDTRSPDSHVAFHAAAARFEELDRPLLARSAAILLMIGMSPNDLAAGDSYPLKVAKAGLVHENVEAVAELADFVCAAAQRLAAMTHLGEEAWRRARFRTVALLLSQLSLAYVESDDTERQAKIFDAAVELATKQGAQHEDLFAIVARLLGVMSREQILQRLPRLFALLLYANRMGGVQPSAEPFVVLSKRADLKGALQPGDPALEERISTLLGLDPKSRRQADVMSADSALRAVAARRILALQHLGALTEEQNDAFETVLRAEAEQAFGHDHETIALEEFEWLDIALTRHGRAKPSAVWSRIIEVAQSHLSDRHSSLDLSFEQKFQPILDAKLHVAHPRKWPDDKFAHALAEKFGQWADDVLALNGQVRAGAASSIFVARLVGEFILPWALRQRGAAVRHDLMRSIQTRLEKLVEVDLPFESAFVKITISGPIQEREPIIGRLRASVRSADPKHAQSAIDAIYEWCKRAKDLLDGKAAKTPKGMAPSDVEDSPSRDDLLRDRDTLVDAVRALLIEPHHPNAIMAIECFSRLYVELGLGEDTRQKESLAIYVAMFRRSLARPRNDVPPHRVRALAALLAQLEENIGAGETSA